MPRKQQSRSPSPRLDIRPKTPGDADFYLKENSKPLISTKNEKLEDNVEGNSAKNKTLDSTVKSAEIDKKSGVKKSSNSNKPGPKESHISSKLPQNNASLDNFTLSMTFTPNHEKKEKADRLKITTSISTPAAKIGTNQKPADQSIAESIGKVSAFSEGNMATNDDPSAINSDIASTKKKSASRNSSAKKKTKSPVVNIRSPTPNPPRTINKAVVGIVARTRPPRDVNEARSRDARPGFQGNRPISPRTPEPVKNTHLEVKSRSKGKRPIAPTPEATGTRTEETPLTEAASSKMKSYASSNVNDGISQDSISLNGTSSMEIPMATDDDDGGSTTKAHGGESLDSIASFKDDSEIDKIPLTAIPPLTPEPLPAVVQTPAPITSLSELASPPELEQPCDEPSQQEILPTTECSEQDLAANLPEKTRCSPISEEPSCTAFPVEPCTPVPQDSPTMEQCEASNLPQEVEYQRTISSSLVAIPCSPTAKQHTEAYSQLEMLDQQCENTPVTEEPLVAVECSPTEEQLAASTSQMGNQQCDSSPAAEEPLEAMQSVSPSSPTEGEISECTPEVESNQLESSSPTEEHLPPSASEMENRPPESPPATEEYLPAVQSIEQCDPTDVQLASCSSEVGNQRQEHLSPAEERFSTCFSVMDNQQQETPSPTENQYPVLSSKVENQQCESPSSAEEQCSVKSAVETDSQVSANEQSIKDLVPVIPSDSSGSGSLAQSTTNLDLSAASLSAVKPRSLPQISGIQQPSLEEPSKQIVAKKLSSVDDSATLSTTQNVLLSNKQRPRTSSVVSVGQFLLAGSSAAASRPSMEPLQAPSSLPKGKISPSKAPPSSLPSIKNNSLKAGPSNALDQLPPSNLPSEKDFSEISFKSSQKNALPIRVSSDVSHISKSLPPKANLSQNISLMKTNSRPRLSEKASLPKKMLPPKINSSQKVVPSKTNSTDSKPRLSEKPSLTSKTLPPKINSSQKIFPAKNNLPDSKRHSSERTSLPSKTLLPKVNLSQNVSPVKKNFLDSKPRLSEQPGLASKPILSEANSSQSSVKTKKKLSDPKLLMSERPSLPSKTLPPNVKSSQSVFSAKTNSTDSKPHLTEKLTSASKISFPKLASSQKVFANKTSLSDSKPRLSGQPDQAPKPLPPKANSSQKVFPAKTKLSDSKPSLLRQRSQDMSMTSSKRISHHPGSNIRVDHEIGGSTATNSGEKKIKTVDLVNQSSSHLNKQSPQKLVPTTAENRSSVEIVDSALMNKAKRSESVDPRKYVEFIILNAWEQILQPTEHAESSMVEEILPRLANLFDVDLNAAVKEEAFPDLVASGHGPRSLSQSMINSKDLYSSSNSGRFPAAYQNSTQYGVRRSLQKDPTTSSLGTTVNDVKPSLDKITDKAGMKVGPGDEKSGTFTTDFGNFVKPSPQMSASATPSGTAAFNVQPLSQDVALMGSTAAADKVQALFQTGSSAASNLKAAAQENQSPLEQDVTQANLDAAANKLQTFSQNVSSVTGVEVAAYDIQDVTQIGLGAAADKLQSFSQIVSSAVDINTAAQENQSPLEQDVTQANLDAAANKLQSFSQNVSSVTGVEVAAYDIQDVTQIGLDAAADKLQSFSQIVSSAVDINTAAQENQSPPEQDVTQANLNAAAMKLRSLSETDSSASLIKPVTYDDQPFIQQNTTETGLAAAADNLQSFSQLASSTSNLAADGYDVQSTRQEDPTHANLAAAANKLQSFSQIDSPVAGIEITAVEAQSLFHQDVTQTNLDAVKNKLQSSSQIVSSAANMEATENDGHPFVPQDGTQIELASATNNLSSFFRIVSSAAAPPTLEYEAQILPKVSSNATVKQPPNSQIHSKAASTETARNYIPNALQQDTVEASSNAPVNQVKQFPHAGASAADTIADTPFPLIEPIVSVDTSTPYVELFQPVKSSAIAPGSVENEAPLPQTDIPVEMPEGALANTFDESLNTAETDNLPLSQVDTMGVNLEEEHFSQANAIVANLRASVNVETLFYGVDDSMVGIMKTVDVELLPHTDVEGVSLENAPYDVQHLLPSDEVAMNLDATLNEDSTFPQIDASVMPISMNPDDVEFSQTDASAIGHGTTPYNGQRDLNELGVNMDATVYDETSFSQVEASIAGFVSPAVAAKPSQPTDGFVPSLGATPNVGQPLSQPNQLATYPDAAMYSDVMSPQEYDQVIGPSEAVKESKFSSQNGAVVAVLGSTASDFQPLASEITANSDAVANGQVAFPPIGTSLGDQSNGSDGNIPVSIKNVIMVDLEVVPTEPLPQVDKTPALSDTKVGEMSIPPMGEIVGDVAKPTNNIQLFSYSDVPVANVVPNDTSLLPKTAKIVEKSNLTINDEEMLKETEPPEEDPVVASNASEISAGMAPFDMQAFLQTSGIAPPMDAALNSEAIISQTSGIGLDGKLDRTKNENLSSLNIDAEVDVGICAPELKLSVEESDTAASNNKDIALTKKFKTVTKKDEGQSEAETKVEKGSLKTCNTRESRIRMMEACRSRGAKIQPQRVDASAHSWFDKADVELMTEELEQQPNEFVVREIVQHGDDVNNKEICIENQEKIRLKSNSVEDLKGVEIQLLKDDSNHTNSFDGCEYERGSGESFHYLSDFNVKELGLSNQSSAVCIHSRQSGDARSYLFLFDSEFTGGCKQQYIWNRIRKAVNNASQRCLIGVIAECTVPVADQLCTIPADLIVTSCGRHLYRKGIVGTETMREHLGSKLMHQLVSFILCYIGWLKLPVRRGKFVDVYDRHIMVCPVGNGGSRKDYDRFIKLDRRADIRLNFIKSLVQKFEDTDLTFSLSGDLNIRIGVVGWDQGLTRTSMHQETFTDVIVFSPTNDLQIVDELTREKRCARVKHVKTDSSSTVESTLDIVLSVL